MVKSPVRHKKPVMGLSNWPYGETCTRGASFYPWRAFCMDTNTLKISYDKYINSDEWTNLKDNYFLTHEKICSACGSLSSIDLHHMTYDRLGNEKDIDLIPLCDICHDQYHDIYDRSSITDTKKFVAIKQASIIGKQIFSRNRNLIAGVLNKASEQFSESFSKLKDNLKGIRYNRLSGSEKDGFKIQAMTVRNVVDSVPWLSVVEIIKLESPDEVHLDKYDLANHVNLNIEEISKRLEYRWVIEEIKALMPQHQKTTEIDKLKRILEHAK